MCIYINSINKNKYLFIYLDTLPESYYNRENNESSKGADHEINTQNSVAILYTSSEQSKEETSFHLLFIHNSI